MRYLRQQVLNRRAPADQRFYVDMTDSIVMNTSNNMLIPKGTGDQLFSTGTPENQRPVAPLNGMMRYNTTTSEVEVYQSDKWRSLKYKEISPIIQQGIGIIDGLTYFYGPLHSSYNPTNLSSNVPTTGGVAVGQYLGQNVLVFVENVFQIYNTNYTITQNPSATLTTTLEALNGSTTLTLTSTSTIPTGCVVSGTNIQPGTIATVISDTDVSLNLPISGGNISAGETISFVTAGTAKAGYYLNFTSDPDYLGLIGKPITVLLGFDQ